MKLSEKYSFITGSIWQGNTDIDREDITDEVARLEEENASFKRENERLRDEILRENTKFGQVERDDLIG